MGSVTEWQGRRIERPNRVRRADEVRWTNFDGKGFEQELKPRVAVTRGESSDKFISIPRKDQRIDRWARTGENTRLVSWRNWGRRRELHRSFATITARL